MKNLKTIFYLKKDKTNDNGEAPIYCKINISQTSTTINTGRVISSERWKVTNHLKNPHITEKEKKIFKILLSIENKIDTIFLDSNNSKITAIEIKSKYLGKDIENKKIGLIEVCNFHNKKFKLKVENGDRSEATLERYERIAKFLQEFILKKFGANDTAVESITPEFVYDFEEHLLYTRKIANNSTLKYMRNINTFFKLSLKLKKIKNNPFSVYEGKLEKVETTYLTPSEIEKIENKVLNNERLIRVRDIFMFSCYTGYAPADAMLLTNNNISYELGTDWMKAQRKKTKIDANVPILAPAMRIIKKYQDHPIHGESKFLLPQISNQKMNEYLKELITSCGIKKKVTWYTSRHTFATTIALANEIDIVNVAKMMGHTNITQTQHYAKILNSSVAKDMSKLNSIYK